MKKIIAQTATAVCIVFTVMMAWFLAMEIGRAHV